MAPDDRELEQPWLGRESIFRRKLNQLRTTGHISKLPQVDSVNRIKELEKSTYLDAAHANLHSAEPEDLERLTLLDALTDVYNHQTIMRILRDELKRGKRYQYSSIVLMLSIDKLDQVTKRFGAMAYDSILKGTANFLMGKLRDVDIPGRYDAEAFVVICPNTDVQGGTTLAERLRNAITQDRISDIGQNWAVTASIGLAEFPRQAVTEEEITHLAFNAMLESRKKGGDAVSVAELASSS